jgi:hypothetical protein
VIAGMLSAAAIRFPTALASTSTLHSIRDLRQCYRQRGTAERFHQSRMQRVEVSHLIDNSRIVLLR